MNTREQRTENEHRGRLRWQGGVGLLLLILTSCAFNRPLTQSPPSRPAKDPIDIHLRAKPMLDPTRFRTTDLTLDMCLTIGANNNRSLQRKTSAFERAKLGRSIAETEVFLPTMSASYNMTEDANTGSGNVDLTYDGIAGFEIEPFLRLRYDDSDESEDLGHTTAYGITVSRPIFAIHEHIRQRLPISRAAKGVLVAQNEFRLESRQVRLAVTQAFYAVQRVNARLSVREKRVTDARDFLRVTKRRVENGFSAPVDVVNAAIDLNRAEADLISERTSLENSLDVLREVMGLELSREVSLQNWDQTQLPDYKYDLTNDTVHVASHHERIVNLILEIELAEREIKVERDAVRPDLVLSVTAQRDSEGDSFFTDSADEAEDEILVGLSYEWALDFNKADRARLRQSKHEQIERYLRLKDAEIDIVKSLRRIARDIEQFKERIELAEVLFIAERNKLDATTTRYERGNVDNLEVTRAKQALDSAEIALLESRINLLLAIERYKALIPVRT